MKKCCDCKKLLNLSCFGKLKKATDGLQYKCKNCKKQHRLDNLEHEKTIAKKSRKKHREKILVKTKIYNLTHKKEKQEYDQKYYQENKEEIIDKHNEYQKNKRKINMEYKIKIIISSAIYKALKNNNSSKNGESCFKYLSYTKEDLLLHIENLFEPWMTWNNWGIYNTETWNDNDSATWVWNIDHIIPQSEFNYISMEDQAFKDCWALSNLRPLSAKQNILEGANRIRHKKIS